MNAKKQANNKLKNNGIENSDWLLLNGNRESIFSTPTNHSNSQHVLTHTKSMALTLNKDAYGLMTLVGALLLVCWFFFEAVRYFKLMPSSSPPSPSHSSKPRSLTGSNLSPTKGLGEPLLSPTDSSNDSTTNFHHRNTEGSKQKLKQKQQQ